ncbi:MAG: hypothetical protein ACFFAU_20140 [Candidatus Hodarchaeota archaeon]
MKEISKKCKKCGQLNTNDNKFCIKCGKSLSISNVGNKVSLTKKQRRIISFIIIAVPLVSLILIQLIKINFGQPINPDTIEWTEIEITNVTRNKLEWVNIIETKYAIKGPNLFFLVKWNGTVPVSINSNNLTAPRYILYRKADISWMLHDEGEASFFKGSLLVGINKFILFEFNEGSLDFRGNHDINPFVNDTSTAFAVTYQKGAIPDSSVGNISIVQASEYIGYHQYQMKLNSLLEIPESPLGIIKIDGNRTDWYNSQIQKIQMNSDTITRPEGWNFPVFEKILMTRTNEGIFQSIDLSNGNLTEFMQSQGILRVKINWTTIIAAFNGSYAADYALETYFTYSLSEHYINHNIALTIIAGTDFSPSTTKTWQLQNNNSRSETCFETIFPGSIILPLYEHYEKIYFYTTMIVVWF